MYFLADGLAVSIICTAIVAIAIFGGMIYDKYYKKK